MDWPTLEEAFRIAVRDAAGLSDTSEGRETHAVVWGDNPEVSAWHASPHIELRFRGVDAIGVDEERATYDGGGPTNAVSLAGPRRVRIEVRIESLDQADARAVSVLASQIRTRLRRSSIREALYTGGFAIAEIGETTPANYLSADRSVSVAIFEVVLNAAENDTDDTTGAGDWIDVAEVGSDTVDHVDGTPAGAQMDPIEIGG